MNRMIQTLAPDMATDFMPRSRVLGAYVHEARAECLRYLRNPGFILPMLLFPAVFYFMFGVLLARYNGADAARLFLANYATFGVMGPGLFGFGVALALEREDGLLDLKRALPMPPGAYLLGKMVMALLGAAVIVVILITMAVFLAKAPLASTQMLALFATGVAGAVPFCAIGLCLGTDQGTWRTGLHQSDLSADGVPVRAVVSVVDDARVPASGCPDLAQLPSRSTGAGRGRLAPRQSFDRGAGPGSVQRRLFRTGHASPAAQWLTRAAA